MEKILKKYNSFKKIYIKKAETSLSKTIITYLKKSLFTVFDVKNPKTKNYVKVRVDKPYNLLTSFAFPFNELEYGSYSSAVKQTQNITFDMFLERNLMDINEKIIILEWILNPSSRDNSKYNSLSFFNNLNIEPKIVIMKNIHENDEYYYITWDLTKNGICKNNSSQDLFEMPASSMFEYLDILKCLSLDTKKRCELWWKKYGKSYIKSCTFSIND